MRVHAHACVHVHVYFIYACIYVEVNVLKIDKVIYKYYNVKNIVQLSNTLSVTLVSHYLII